MQTIDACTEIRLALTPSGIATCHENAYRPASLAVTAQHTYHIPLLSIDRPRLIIDINPNHRRFGHRSSVAIVLRLA
jgi:hypothetical protein